MKAIAAMANNRVIGKDGKIPWHYPVDLKWFKKQTKGGILVMGRKTYESMKDIDLGDRHIIVISTTFKSNDPSVTVWSDINKAIKATKSLITPTPEKFKEFWLCGGGTLYKQLLPYCTDLYLTEIYKGTIGDVKFPAFNKWFEFYKTIKKTDDFVINHYKRKVEK